MEHALTSLAVASPLIHVFDAPTRFLGALWLPYRRDRGQLEAALAAAGPVQAVFAHADVVMPRPIHFGMSVVQFRLLRYCRVENNSRTMPFDSMIYRKGTAAYKAARLRRHQRTSATPTLSS